MRRSCDPRWAADRYVKELRSGRSEERIGKVIRPGRPPVTSSSRRSTAIRDQPLHAPRCAGRSRRALPRSVDRVGLHLPIRICRRPSEVTAKGGAIEELTDCDEGLCDAVGLAAGRVDVMMPILGADFDALITHNRFTLVNHNAEPMIAFAAGKGCRPQRRALRRRGLRPRQRIRHPLCLPGAERGDVRPIRAIEEIRPPPLPPGAVAPSSPCAIRACLTICGVGKPGGHRHRALGEHAGARRRLRRDRRASISRDDPEATRNRRAALILSGRMARLDRRRGRRCIVEAAVTASPPVRQYS